MSKLFRMTVVVEMQDGVDSKTAEVRMRDGQGRILEAKVLEETPPAGAQVAFIYKSSSMSPCHAVVKKKNGPWSANRFGFCGVEPEIGPVGSIDQPQGGLCPRCADFVCQSPDGTWVVREGAPLPGAKVHATLDYGGCDDD